MKNRMTARILVLIAAMALMLAAGGAEETGETVTGYFRTNKNLRPRMEASKESLESIPAYTVMTIRVVRGYWGEYTSERGITGYIFFQEIVPVPEYTPCEPFPAYCKERQSLRSLPEGGQKSEKRIEAGQLITVDGEWQRYYHVRLADGETGYVMQKTVSKADFTLKQTDMQFFCVAEAAAAMEMPLVDAKEVFSVMPGTIYRTNEVCGDYYVLRTEAGDPAYVWKGNARKLSATDAMQQSFFQTPVMSGQKGKIRPEDVYRKGVIKRDGATLYRTEGEDLALAEGESVYVYASYGGFCGVRGRKVFGYVLQEDVELLDRAAMTEQIRALDLSGAKIVRNEFLDVALPLLEEGNPFLLRYNVITGAELEPLFPLGMPYFWGGRNYRAITEKWPEYTVREDWQSSGGYYLKGNFYVYGFDCIGLVKHVYAKSGHAIGDSVSGLGEYDYCRTKHHVWCSRCSPLPEDWTEAAARMQVGDLLLLHYPGTHAMMYIGTLRDWGYTEEQVPALAEALDYPLMIQSGGNPYCYFRFKNMLDNATEKRFQGVLPPDGGASICIVGLERDNAEFTIEYLERTAGCFEVEGACVTTFSFRNVRDYFIYRITPVEQESTEEAQNS